MSEYFEVARHLGMVRRAWKRAAALAGLALVCMEAIGLLTVALLLDWIYQPMPAVRGGLFVVVLGAIGVLAARHVIAPLLRKISDEQLAMFVEEHSDQFEGALITAAELNGEQGHSQTPQAVIDAVMRAAVSRADRVNVRSLVDFRRLKKYALAAVLVVAGYGLMCLAFPDTIGRHASRVMEPWRKSGEDLRNFAGGSGANMPVQFTLSKGDSRMLRRETFDLQAGLSRSSGEPVLLNFRPAGDAKAAWRAVPMKEVDKVNTFAGALEDVDENQEFYVSTGADRSAVFKIDVYEQLKLTGFEVTTRYPAYLKFADRVEVVPTGELMVPAGSKVKLRILTNTPLASGEIMWQDGRREKMAVENTDKGSAAVAFDISKDTSYTYTVVDTNGQKETSAAECSVRALPDNPPTLEVKYPLGAVSANPLGEITFSAEAVDDWAVGGVDLVYQRQLPMNEAGESPPVMAPVRVALALSRAGGKDAGVVFPDVVEGTVRLALEDLKPAAAPEEIISYYLECHDRKGQVVDSEIQMIAVERFDEWPMFDLHPMEEPHFKIIKNISEYVEAAWKLERQKGTLKPEEFAAQAKALATSMMDPETKRMYPFYERKKVPPEKRAHADRADKYLASGHDALMAGDVGKAVADFRVVLAELTIIKLDKSGVAMFTANYGTRGLPPDDEKDLSKLFQQMQVEVEQVTEPPNWNPPEAKAAEKIKKAAEALVKQQAEVVKKANQIAQAGTAKNPTEGAKDEDKDKDQERKQAAKDAEALAGEQDKVAEKTQKEAMPDPVDAHADPEVKAMTNRMAEAAKAMRDASRNLKDKNTEQAAADARRAQGELQKVVERADAIRHEALAGAVAQAQTTAAKLLNEQKALTKDTATLTKDTKKTDTQSDVEFKKLTYRQAELQAKTGQFKKDVEELRNMAQREAKPETAKHIEETHQEMTKGEAAQKMVNAVVELQAKHGEAAGQEQAKAEQGLEKVLTALGKADESLAADRESQLARAKEEAARIDKGLKDLGAVAKGAATQPAANGPTSQPVAKGPASQPAVASTQKGSKPEDEAGKPLNEKEKQAVAEDLTYEMQRLATHLADRDFADKHDQEYLSAAAKNAGGLTDEMLKNDNKRNEIATVVRRVRDKLEAEYQVTLDAKRLQDAQREDCPPSYRQMVNKYYEALSEAGK